MKRTNKRLTGVQSQEKGLSLPPLNAVEFSARLQDLLSKVSVQNRYAQRISQCNIKNMEELQRAKQELQRIAEQRKLKQLRSGNDQDLLEQLSRRANTSEQQLKSVFKELVDAKREIKALKKEIGNLQKSNLQLQTKVMEMKRERYYQISAAKEEVENSLLATEIKRYLSASDKVSSHIKSTISRIFSSILKENCKSLLNLKKLSLNFTTKVLQDQNCDFLAAGKTVDLRQNTFRTKKQNFDEKCQNSYKQE